MTDVARTEWLLVAIGLATMTMAVAQLVMIAALVRTALRGRTIADRLVRETAPILSDLQDATADAAEATTIAAMRAQRVSDSLHDLSVRADTLLHVAQAFVRPAGKLSLLIAAARALRPFLSSKERRQ